jgi:TIR domain
MFAGMTAVIFRYKGRSPALGACIGAVFIGVTGFIDNLYVGLGGLILGLGLLNFLPKAAIRPADHVSPTKFKADGTQHARTPNKNSIFISYRREDSAEVAGRIYDRLVQRFGKEAVFKDVDSIPYGIDFRTYIMNVVGSCGTLIAVIGDQWLMPGKSGNRRIDDPSDFVRTEITSALQRKVPVIPLLVKNAEMPKENELPDVLRDMTYRNAIKVRTDPDFHPDMDRLIKSLEQQVVAPSRWHRRRDRSI